jgi:spermidine/putrescine transport system substrate-binding protein
MGSQRLILNVLVVVVVVVSALIFLRPRTSGQPVLRVCTWSNYYPETVLQEFTQATGIRLEISYIASNEELFAKFKAGATGFDVIQPSDYMIRQMSRLNMLLPLDHHKLSNLHHLDPYFTNLPYDPGLKFSVPLTWGTSGIAVNTAKVKIPPEGVSWKLIFESPDFHHTSMLDDMRESMGAALLWRGKSLNSEVTADWQQAQAEIAAIKGKILMFSSEPKALLLNEELTIAHIFSTDGISAQAENPKIKYFIPKEGASFWTDNFAIPATSKYPDQAHKFINYFLEPDNALKVSLQNHLATPNKTAKLRLPASESGNPEQYPPPEIFEKFQTIHDLPDLMPALNRMWTELKSS